jgi:tetratricopeptide (TPR) repeat protein
LLYFCHPHIESTGLYKVEKAAMIQNSALSIPKDFKIIRANLALDLFFKHNGLEGQEQTIAQDLQEIIAHKYQGSGQFFNVDLTNSNAKISWGIPKGTIEVDSLNKQAFTLAKQKNLNEAINSWRKALYINNMDPDLFYNQGLAYFESRNLNKALDRCHEAVRVCPVYHRAYFLLGSVYSKMRKFYQSKEFLEQGLILQPDNVSALVNLGAVYSILKMSKDAIQMFERATAHSPKEIKAHLGLGKIYLAQNDYDNSNRCFKLVIALDPDGKLGNIAKNSLMVEQPDIPVSNNETVEIIKSDDPDKLYSNAFQAYLNCNYKLAEAYYSEYLNLNSGDSTAWANTAICQLRLGKKELSVASAQKAIQFASKSARIYKQASIIFDACNLRDKSEKAAKSAIEFGKKDSVTLTLLGIAQFERNEIQESVKTLQDAINQNPNNLRARFIYAKVLKVLGQTDTAKQHFEEILWTQTESPLKEKARIELLEF